MNKYSFELIDDYFTKDEKYPSLIQTTLIFKKNNKIIKKSFDEELKNNYENVKIVNDSKSIFSRFKIFDNVFLYSLE